MMNTIVANSRTEQSEAVLAPALYAEHRKFWLDKQPELGDIILKLPDACIDEFDRVVKAGAGSDLSEAVRAAIPQTDELARQVRHQLEFGCGAVLIDRIPAERYSVEENRKLCGYLSSLIAPLMEQNFEGVKLYDVMDKKVETGEKVRRSITNLRQNYHTDGGWVSAPARYIGLYCIRSAELGGFSRITSIMAAYDAMFNGDERAAIQKLSESHPWDRQGEHGRSDQPFAMNPLFVSNENGFLSRWYESYVRDGYDLKGEKMDEETSQALAIVAKYLDRQNSIRFLLETGQFQYVNNYTVVHGREAFEDSERVGGRHLIRVWHQTSPATEV